MLQLNEEQIVQKLAESESATFDVDGQVVDRWVAQEGGEWRGRRELPCERHNSKPNLRPKLLTISTEGKLIDEIDLLELGTGEPLLICDFKRGTLVDVASRLDQSRDYVVICDTDLSIRDAVAEFKQRDRSVYRLVSPWRSDLSVVCDGIEYWQPQIGVKKQFQPILLTIKLPAGCGSEIESTSPVQIMGVPADATAASLIIGDSSHSVPYRDGVWQTDQPVQMTLGIALGEERVRVRLASSEYSRTVTPKLSLNLRGIACDSTIDSEPHWELLKRDRAMNRAYGSGRSKSSAANATLCWGVKTIPR